MKAMRELCALLKNRYPKESHKSLEYITGISRSTIGNSFAGKQYSIPLAEWIVDNVGGKEWLDRLIVEKKHRSGYKSKNKTPITQPTKHNVSIGDFPVIHPGRFDASIIV